MTKPAGARCNLRCTYCYYVGKNEPPGGEAARTETMDATLLERYIAERLASSPGPVTHFEWHGGEPTLLGIEYFRTIVRLQKRLRPAGRMVSNGIQTNGLLINEAWADFLASEGFSVGLSLDGPADIHDRFRRSIEGRPTHARVVKAFALLKARKVFCNILCVLSSANVDEPDRVYDFFKAIGVTYLQFLPLVVRKGPNSVSDATAEAEAIGKFLCRVFDRWVVADVGRLVIQTFDEALRPVHGVEHALCVHRETCGDVAVLERDGSFYACDHFVDAAHRVGSLRERSLAELASDPLIRAFGEAKKASLPRLCRECLYRSLCNGGCPKDRFLKAPDGEDGLNYLCAAYRALFAHAVPALTRLSAHIRSGRSLREFVG